MSIAANRKEENYLKYCQLLQNPDYIDVIFDEQSGGVSAIHIQHKFDKSLSPWGVRRGDYELYVVNLLRSLGYVIILLPENGGIFQKRCDCVIDGIAAEIKTIESNGRWAVRTKIYNAAKQGADIVILYFANPQLFSAPRIIEGWRMYEEIRRKRENWKSISEIIAIAGAEICKIIKPSG